MTGWDHGLIPRFSLNFITSCTLLLSLNSGDEWLATLTAHNALTCLSFLSLCSFCLGLTTRSTSYDEMTSTTELYL